jgi:hypothetical protein
MRIIIAAALVAGLAGTASAQVIDTAPRTYPKLQTCDNCTTSFPQFAPVPCCITFSGEDGNVTLDMDKGTVDLHGAKIDDAARSFWDAVRKGANHPAPKPRAYTLDEIDRMRAAVTKLTDVACYGSCEQWEVNRSRLIEDRLRTYMAAGISVNELETRAGLPHCPQAGVAMCPGGAK